MATVLRDKGRDEILSAVEQQLTRAGWPLEGIFRESAVRIETALYRPSFALVYNSYPFALLEVSENLTAFDESQRTGKPTPPILLVADGKRSRICSSDSATEWTGVPSPRDLWSALGRVWDDEDPRLWATGSEAPGVGFHQAMAIGLLLDHLLKPARQGQVVLSPGSGAMRVSEALLLKLLRTGRSRRALFLVDRVMIAEQVHRRLSAQGISAARLASPIDSDSETEVLVSTAQLLRDSRLGELPVGSFDLLMVHGVEGDSLLQPILERFRDAIAVGVFGWTGHERAFGQPVYQFTLDDARLDEPVPEGFRGVKLADIADISVGPHPITRTRRQEGGGASREAVQLVLGRSLEPDGSWDLSRAEKTDVDSAFVASDRSRMQRGDILLATIQAKMRPRWAVVPSEVPFDVRIGSSVVRIRVRDTSVHPADVATFLTSDSGRRATAYLASAVYGRLHLTPSMLGQIRVLLPERSGPAALAPAAELSAVAAALRSVRALVPDLEVAEREAGEAQAPSALVLSVAERLRDIASTLAPPPLAERVISDYPTPIAKAYRQFHDSRFNIYERVGRLRDVFEAVSFFVYNTVLADALQRLKAEDYPVHDRNARRAYAGYSMSHRLTFVETILAVARVRGKQELFMPELASGSFVARARELQEFRNQTAHSITAVEGRQRDLLDRYEPIVDSLLDELAFVADYRLVRIPSFYVRNGRHVRRMEVYRGVVPDLDEDELDEDETPALVEHDRLVLLNEDDEALDLYPMYQLIANAETRFETHICFLKQKRGDRLEGESIQAAGEIELGGMMQFDALVRKLEEPSR